MVEAGPSTILDSRSPIPGASRAIGIFGGTFAPIHNGHLRLALELRERLQLDRVHLIPAGEPPHRERPTVPAQRRLDWVRLACGDEPGLIADDREVRRGGRSYTYDTLAGLRTEWPEASIVLLVGDDAANQFHTWHRWQEIPDLAHLVFVQRPSEPSAPAPPLQALLRRRRATDPSAFGRQPAGLFMAAQLPPLAISSTRIRRLLAAGRSVRGLLPQAVIDSFTPEDLGNLTHDDLPASD
ncbi:nicotinate-nucleotide adenylyltransferase [Panacagrimonas sp.]|uniref:nicotinate-nucleotide adenylyltransferase n=1 Tax=Panacagrimonas sp. TaxID=2480088 RepID=UPI003B52E10F